MTRGLGYWTGSRRSPISTNFWDATFCSNDDTEWQCYDVLADRQNRPRKDM